MLEKQQQKENEQTMTFTQTRESEMYNNATPEKQQPKEDEQTKMLAYLRETERYSNATPEERRRMEEQVKALFEDKKFKCYVERECKSDEERANLVNDVESFWSRLKEYEIENNRAYGLAVGRVQSGKTRNYIGLLFKAIDDGYNTIIVLTSKNNLLAQQTHRRVADWFGEKGLKVSTLNLLTRVDEDGKDGIRWVGGEFLANANRINVGIIIKKFNDDIDITSIDVNSRAIELANINAEQNKTLIKASLCLDIETLNTLFDSVILNPPIRAGKVVIYELYEKAYKVLNEKGSLYIVIQKKQGAVSSINKLSTLFKQVDILDKSGGYWIIQATK